MSLLNFDTFRKILQELTLVFQSFNDTNGEAGEKTNIMTIWYKSITCYSVDQITDFSRSRAEKLDLGLCI